MERFVEFKVKDLVEKEQKVICVTELASVEEVISTLSKNHIHGVVVMDVSSNLLGFIDYLDILAFLLEDISKQAVSSGGAISDNIKSDDLNQLMKRASRFKAANILSAGLLNRASTNPTVVIQEDVTVKDALELFAKGVHRLCVARGNSVFGMLTQTSIVSWLLARPERLGVLRGKTARDLGWTREVKGDPNAVLCTSIVVDAYMQLRRGFRTSLPVVDQNGIFVGVLSATDIKLLDLNNFALLQEDVRSFLRDVRAKAHSVTKNYRVTCSLDNTLGDIMEKMSRERVHAIAVVDPLGHLDAIITLTDIVKVLLLMPYSTDI